MLVKDAGAGISKQDQEHLFQMYSQIQADTLQQGKGSGLGLVLAKEIINLHGEEEEEEEEEEDIDDDVMMIMIVVVDDDDDNEEEEEEKDDSCVVTTTVSHKTLSPVIVIVL